MGRVWGGDERTAHEMEPTMNAHLATKASTTSYKPARIGVILPDRLCSSRSKGKVHRALQEADGAVYILCDCGLVDEAGADVTIATRKAVNCGGR